MTAHIYAARVYYNPLSGGHEPDELELENARIALTLERAQELARDAIAEHFEFCGEEVPDEILTAGWVEREGANTWELRCALLEGSEGTPDTTIAQVVCLPVE